MYMQSVRFWVIQFPVRCEEGGAIGVQNRVASFCKLPTQLKLEGMAGEIIDKNFHSNPFSIIHAITIIYAGF